MDSLLSFPVGLFHPLQHDGLSRRSPSSRHTRPESSDSCPLTTGAIRVCTSKGGPLTFQVPVTVLELNELSEL
jgi:hypothetical protein